ncbi:MAG TPA: KEOPS complex kinase/ATPase Bud32 [Candidatus Pacearchaeota archaeon]|nr:KEOPS complex kinase/ATPase Bud32 [Candidatus Pacearchaeota archaeon]
MKKEKIIQQGAEAVIIQKENEIIKRRIPKSYRIKELDEKIRKHRTRSESKILEKANKIGFSPRLISTDEKNKEIVMEFIQGKKLSEQLEKFSFVEQKQIMETIGKNIGKLHSQNIIHGDLTLANMILKSLKDVFFIDFGLSFISQKIEDCAVDLHLFKESLKASYPEKSQELFHSVIQGYTSIPPANKNKTPLVLQQLEKVERRGRYKH